MSSAMLFAFPDRREDDREDFCFVSRSAKLKQIQLDSPQPSSELHFLTALWIENMCRIQHQDRVAPVLSSLSSDLLVGSCYDASSVEEAKKVGKDGRPDPSQSTHIWLLVL